jgi:hypothetical protein
MLIDSLCRRWIYTSAEFELDKNVPSGEAWLFHLHVHAACEHARYQMDPASANYVQLVWTWV